MDAEETYQKLKTKRGLGWLIGFGNWTKRRTARAWASELFFELTGNAEEIFAALLERTTWKRIGPNTFEYRHDRGSARIEVPVPFDRVEFVRRAISAELAVLYAGDPELVPELQEVARQEIERIAT